MERMNISGLFYRYKVCSFSDSCYNSTNSELAIELRFLVLLWDVSQNVRDQGWGLIGSQHELLEDMQRFAG
jgi:hypothetical protein